MSDKKVLEVRNVSYSYGTDAHSSDLNVLKDVAFSVAAGETTSIMGRSGCGKSTLVSLITGLDQPRSGEIVVCDQNLAQLKGQNLHRFRAENIGIVFQQFHLLEHMTAFENARLALDLARDPDADSKALVALEKVGLSARRDHFPKQLSRGECQRVAIARVMALDISILVADEPTGSLDSATGQKVMDLLFDLSREKNLAMILVTHDPQLAQRCSTRFEMRDGRLFNA